RLRLGLRSLLTSLAARRSPRTAVTCERLPAAAAPRGCAPYSLLSGRDDHGGRRSLVNARPRLRLGLCSLLTSLAARRSPRTAVLSERWPSAAAPRAALPTHFSRGTTIAEKIKAGDCLAENRP